MEYTKTTKSMCVDVAVKNGMKYHFEINGADVDATIQHESSITFWDKGYIVATYIFNDLSEGDFDYNNGTVKGVISITIIERYREFDIDAAMRGEPVQTVNGKDVRILTFDMRRGDERLIVALVSSETSKNDNVQLYYYDGRLVSNIANENLRLVMKPTV